MDEVLGVEVIKNEFVVGFVISEGAGIGFRTVGIFVGLDRLVEASDLASRWGKHPDITRSIAAASAALNPRR